MSKSIIIIDTPKTCAECRASYCADIWYCYGGTYRRMLTSNEIYAKPDWCPLKEMPKRKGLFAEMHQYDTDIHYEIGWNDCIEEIEK